MIFNKLRRISVLPALTLALAVMPASAKDADFHLLGTFDAYRAGDPIKLARHAQKIEGHVLTPWVEYWRISLKLEDATNSEAREFFSKYSNTYVAERLRGDWLKVLGKRADWKEFERELADYARDDLEIRCYAWLSRAARGDESALAEAEEMWLSPAELPEGCEKLATLLWERNRIQVADVWRRVRKLFEEGQITAAKVTLGYLPKAEAPDERMLAEAARQPKRLLAKLPAAWRAAAWAGARPRHMRSSGASALGGSGRVTFAPSDLAQFFEQLAHAAPGCGCAPRAASRLSQPSGSSASKSHISSASASADSVAPRAARRQPA